MSRISLFVAALSLSGVALADGQLEGVVFESATGAPWPNAVLRLKKDAGETVEVPLSSDASFSVSVDAATWTVVATGPNGQALGQWPVRIVDDGVSEVLLTLDVSGGSSSADITEPSNDVQDEQTADLPTFPVQGTIVDERGTALSGASIVVRGQSGRSNVDETGTFTVQAPVGSNALSVMLDGYRARTIEFELGEDGGLSLDPIVMVPAGLALDDYTIRAPRIEGGTSALIQERQSSASVNDVLGAEQMSRAGDSDAASALKRVTGLTA